jgi:hypothetical protein
MADTQSTGDTQPSTLSPETRTAVEVLPLLARTDIQPAPNPAQAAVQAVTDAFDRVGRTGGEYPTHRLLVEIHGDDDPTRNPRFLGEPPESEQDGTCSYCGDPYDLHWDQDSEQYLSGREWHRGDCRDRTGGGLGFYADEIPAVTR